VVEDHVFVEIVLTQWGCAKIQQLLKLVGYILNCLVGAKISINSVNSLLPTLRHYLYSLHSSWPNWHAVWRYVYCYIVHSVYFVTFMRVSRFCLCFKMYTRNNVMIYGVAYFKTCKKYVQHKVIRCTSLYSCCWCYLWLVQVHVLLCVSLWQINGCVIQKFPTSLLDLLASLLVITSDESIKGFVQTLKVSRCVL